MSLRPIRSAVFLMSFLFPLLLLGQNIGTVTLVNVRAPVTVAQADGTAVEPVRNGMRVAQGAVVTTGAGGSVILVFSTGTTISVTPGSQVTIENFSQQAAPAGPAPEGVEDNSISRTQLNLGYGEVIGRVKKLRPESEFQVRTPVGVAGVRGTDIIISARREDGRWIVSFGVDDGALSIFSLSGEQVKATGLADLEEGEALLITAQQNEDGSISIISQDKSNLSAEQVEALERVINEQEAQQSTQRSTVPDRVTDPRNLDYEDGNPAQTE